MFGVIDDNLSNTRPGKTSNAQAASLIPSENSSFSENFCVQQPN